MRANTQSSRLHQAARSRVQTAFPQGYSPALALACVATSAQAHSALSHRALAISLKLLQGRCARLAVDA